MPAVKSPVIYKSLLRAHTSQSSSPWLFPAALAAADRCHPLPHSAFSSLAQACGSRCASCSGDILLLGAVPSSDGSELSSLGTPHCVALLSSPFPSPFLPWPLSCLHRTFSSQFELEPHFSTDPNPSFKGNDKIQE